MSEKRIIAIHLPQFHPFKENDEWWGKGFTEWTNVTKCRPRFPGHYQPHLPADLGFYDLRLPEAREAQANLAKEYGIYGFCYYHYWFNGHQLMERPVNEIAASGKPDFPFMLCWANENWTRAWDGGFKEILIEQKHSDEDDIAHINYLIDNFFKDDRYIKIDGKPVFCIYRQDLFPDIKKTINIWREEARKKGVELYLCMFESFNNKGNVALENGFDASVEFQPTSVYNNGYLKKNRCLVRRATNKICRLSFGKYILPEIVSYEKYVNYVLSLPQVKYKRYPCVSPSWDNASRRKRTNFLVFYKSTPKFFGNWLRETMRKFKPFSKEENFVFINAWNEWAEGNHLEPDRKWGRQYLEEVKKCIDAEQINTDKEVNANEV